MIYKRQLLNVQRSVSAVILFTLVLPAFLFSPNVAKATTGASVADLSSAACNLTVQPSKSPFTAGETFYFWVYTGDSSVEATIYEVGITNVNGVSVWVNNAQMTTVNGRVTVPVYNTYLYEGLKPSVDPYTFHVRTTDCGNASVDFGITGPSGFEKTSGFIKKLWFTIETICKVGSMCP